MESADTFNTARLPGTNGKGSKQRRPFGGKRRLHNVVPVRFERSFVSELHNAGELLLVRGERVVVDTTKGPVLGEVSGLVRRRVVERGRVRRIIRRATDEDVARHEENRDVARDAFKFCLQRIKARSLKMKLCQVECMLDKSRILFYFSADHRVDFRQLVRDLARSLDARIEMRQIGVRDGAGLIGGIGPCGKELCCSSFLKSFRSISIRHAKDQGLTLNPKKVSGMCGRLMCCLVYEHPTYKAARKGAPRVNRAVDTPLGSGVVTEVDLLQRKLRILLENGTLEVFPFEQVVVDNDTIMRPREISRAAPQSSRPRTDAGLTRAGADLDQEYVWDDAEVEAKLDSTPAEQPSRRKSRGPSEGGGRRRSRGRRRRRSSGGSSESKADQGPQQGEKSDRPAKSAKTDDQQRRSGGQQTDKSAASGEGGKPKRRRRRSRGRGRRGKGGGGET